jgi:hypothetical protein
MKRSEHRPEIADIHEPKTLQELGVPVPLAMEMEGALRALGGSTRWGVFVTPDGVVHPLRPQEQEEERRRAANG